MKRLITLPFILLSLCIIAGEPHPYFTSPEMPNALHYLPAPPQTNEMRYAYDTAQYNWGKSVRNTPRGEKARLDAEYSIARIAAVFTPVMGIEISETNTPQIWKLLADATKTANFACDSAKKTYMRQRPYMVYNEPTLVPEDEAVLRKNGSYPSGHTTLGWTAALILCEINPDDQDAILKEGFEYGQSRVIAGFHWQSDVDAARLVASAAFARLHTSEAYLKQLRKAQKEYRKKRK
jgi:acid phosphatase (class A)